MRIPNSVLLGCFLLVGAILANSAGICSPTALVYYFSVLFIGAVVLYVACTTFFRGS